LPHWQPAAVQVSAVAGSHVVHEPPSNPHAVVEGMLHVVPVQQPPGHDVGSQMHVPPLHRWPVAHAPPAPQEQAPPSHPSPVPPQLMQLLPAPPHVFAVSDVHVWPEQQPPGQEVASQTQLPW
jgi:hypothetical protein